MVKAAVQVLGLPIKGTAEEALLEELWRSRGEVVWIEQQIQEWETTEDGKVRVRVFNSVLDQYVQVDMTVMEAIAKHPVYAAYRGARDHLAKVAKMASDAKLTERAVKVEEDKLRLLASVVNAAIASAGLEPAAQMAMRKALRAEIEARPELVE